MAKHDPVLSKWLEKKRTKYCSPEIQNELIDIMAQEVLRDLLAEIRESGFFSFMCDETTDSSNLEQCVCCIRWCSDDFEVFEDLIGLYELHSTTALSELDHYNLWTPWYDVDLFDANFLPMILFSIAIYVNDGV